MHPVILYQKQHLVMVWAFWIIDKRG